MKKTYLQPDTEIQKVNVVQMLSASITGVGGGDSTNPINMGGDDDTPEGLDADVKGSIFEENPWEY